MTRACPLPRTPNQTMNKKLNRRLRSRHAAIDRVPVAPMRSALSNFETRQSVVRACNQTLGSARPVPLPDDQLVTANPKVMGGMPVFAGSRVPIEIVLSSLKADVDLEELKLSYPFLTPVHIEAARAYEQEHPSAGTRVLSSRAPSGWKVKSRRVARCVPKE